MPVDLEISSNGDLVFSGGRDLATVRATDLIRQRIALRLRMYRGSWRLNKDLGSDLYQLLSQSNKAEVRARGVSMVVAALKDMRDEISIDEVSVDQDPNNPRGVIVKMAVRAVIRPAPAPAVSFQTEIPLPAPQPSQTTVRA